jgi:beta-mannosidase
MCKGTDWVPMDAFHCRDAERYGKALELAKDIGCNIIRCWGGNVYEDHEFFDFCDRNGIMVWQDFAMACYSYPETERFKKKLQDEATAVIRKLRNHPCIILWAGDNEVDAGTRLFDPNSNSLTREVIPKCVELNDIGRPYLPSSPYISPEAYASGFRSQAYGSALPEDHLWGPRDYYKSEFYKSNRACFVSETGYHGCPSLESIKKFITPEKVWPYAGNDEWILHSTDQNGNDKRVMLMEKQVRVLFGKVPTEPKEYILASQISQAEAKKYFIERMRVDRPHKTGIIWWNFHRRMGLSGRDS